MARAPAEENGSMTKITPSPTLTECASTTPALTRELERLGLDDCCGTRSLAETCRDEQLDPETGIAELTCEPPLPPPDGITSTCRRLPSGSSSQASAPNGSWRGGSSVVAPSSRAELIQAWSTARAPVASALCCRHSANRPGCRG
jgi:hypothetical protein